MVGKNLPVRGRTGKTVSPFLNVHQKPGYRTGQKALTTGQVERLLAHVTDLNHLGLLQLAISTGIRREDIVRVRTKDLDFSNLTVTFYESKKRRIRTVPLNQAVANTLKMLTRINKGSEFIFQGSSEKKRGQGHLSGRSAYNILNKYLAKAGLPAKPFHALRATCIKLCQARGWTPEQTAELVGDTIAVIQQHYSVPSQEEMRDVAREKSLL